MERAQENTEPRIRLEKPYYQYPQNAENFAEKGNYFYLSEVKRTFLFNIFTEFYLS